MRRIFAIGFLPVLFGCAPSDWVSDSYATLEEAEADGLFARGWLPDLLPASATNIRTEINLDLNVSSGEFSFKSEDASVMPERLSEGLPSSSPLSGWDGTIREYTDRGFSSWSFNDEGSTWVFFCKAKIGYCEYRMWLRPHQ